MAIKLPKKLLVIKRKIFSYYREALTDIPGIEFMPEAIYGKANRWLTVLLINPVEFGADREAVRLALEEENIESRPVWKPMHRQPLCRECRIRGGEVSADLFDRGLCLPSGSSLDNADRARIMAAIQSVPRRG